MTDTYKELADRLAKGMNFERNAVVFASAIIDDHGNCNTSSFIKGENALCLELSKNLIIQSIDRIDNNFVKLKAICRLSEEIDKLKNEALTTLLMNFCY